MDFDRLLRIITRMLETNGMIFAGAVAAVILLILMMLVSRRRRNRPKPAQLAQTRTADAPLISDKETVELTLEDDISMTLQNEEVEVRDIELATIDDLADAPAMQAPDQLDDTLSAEFGHLDTPQDNEMTDLDDITIPRVGEAPPPQKSRFFSSSWLHRDKPARNKSGKAGLTTDITFTADDTKSRALAAECARLAEIERKMLALRELYEAGLIASEVYVLKARELSNQV